MNSTEVVITKNLAVTLVLCSAFTFSAGTAFAGSDTRFDRIGFRSEVVCHANQNSAYAAMTTRFQGTLSEHPQVHLLLPAEANRTLSLYGACEKYPTANGNHLVCRVQNDQSSYTVGLFRNKNSKLVSSVVQGEDALLAGDLECQSVGSN